MRKKALIISDDDVLSTVYSANLSVYVGLIPSIVKSLEETKKALEKRNYYDVIVCAYSLAGEENMASKVYSALPGPKLRNNFIIFNNSTAKNISAALPPAIILIPNQFDIKNLVRSTARLLGVTAKDMAQAKVDSHFPLPAKLLSLHEKTNWDIFTKEESGFKQICAKGDSLQPDLVGPDVENIYVPSLHRLSCANAITANAILHLRANASPEEKLKAGETTLESLSDLLLGCDENKKELAQISKACVKAIESAIGQSSELDGLLAYLRENKSGYLYMHSVLASYVSRHILNNITWGNSAQVEKMGHVCFFHDIFLVPIYQKYPDVQEIEDLALSSELEEEDLELLLKHSQMAAQQVSLLPSMPMGIDTIILQHHGVKNGEGFSLKPGDDISPLAKVMIIAEGFVNLIMEAKSNHQKIDNGKFLEALKLKYPKRSYIKIIDTLSNFS